MNNVTLDVALLSPLLMAGANAGKPELRAASFRGSFRYWLRAVLGDGQLDHIAELAKQESRYFGSTRDEKDEHGRSTGWKSGSPLRVRVNGDLRAEKQPDTILLPTDQKFSYIKSGTFSLHFDTHPLRPIGSICDESFWAMLLLAFKFGGFGKRARRGGGSMQVNNVEVGTGDFGGDKPQGAKLLEYQPQTYDELKTHLERIAQYIIDAAPTRVVSSDLPAYSIFHPNHTQVFLASDDRTYDVDYLEALTQDFWELTGAFHHDGGAWGQVKGGRRSSALHVRVHKVGKAHFTLVTVFHRAPAEECAKLKEVTDKLQGNFDLIYGTQDGWV